MPTPNKYRPKVIPTLGKFYYVDYIDSGVPKASYTGIAECVAIYTRDMDGNAITPLYEFAHPDLSTPNKTMTRDLLYAEEVVMEAKF